MPIKNLVGAFGHTKTDKWMQTARKETIITSHRRMTPITFHIYLADLKER